MVYFTSDYLTGAHPEVLKKLCETNGENLPGYGTDSYCESAKEKIRKAFSCSEAEIFFIAGGTQTNQVVIDTCLLPYEGVIAAKSGHIAVHEAGAIEFTGHKVLEIEGKEGKLSAADVEKYLTVWEKNESRESTVFPGMVYISFPTECGTLYSAKELNDLYSTCKRHEIKLYIDGARLAYGLYCSENDVTPAFLASHCDAFYIGGTKCGALIGEAVVFPHKNMPKHFYTQVKQHGALLAKGRLLGVQFDALFTDGLYEKIGRYVTDKAQRLKQLFENKGYSFGFPSPTNQQFVILDDEQMKRIGKGAKFEIWEPYDEDRTVVRFATGWSTTDKDLSDLADLL